ncbi:energy-coupled thiamine transporter ThiT [Candidatus Izemoplasma sp. B36]|uniref:energy-coupled thiamine transporter ThiT n=1 Tax=Candidatus Izemoplasma sp. B36 TaxID=3242468 RepID=UPI0035590966
MKKKEIRALVETGVLVGVAVILDLIFGAMSTFPNGGNIGLGMLPIFILAARRGPKYGLTGGLLLGIISFMFKPYFLSFLQFGFDYLFAFGLLAIGAFIPKSNSKLSRFFLMIAIGSFVRLIMASLAGIFYWAEYIPDGMAYLDGYLGTNFESMQGNQMVIFGSFLYNFAYLFPSAVLCILIGGVMLKRGVVHYRLES